LFCPIRPGADREISGGGIEGADGAVPKVANQDVVAKARPKLALAWTTPQGAFSGPATLQEVVNGLDQFPTPVVEGIMLKRTIPSLWRPGGPWKASPQTKV
jgi:hypothetical protein